jgi:mannose-1-phosphate guanylyltransferase/mannose-6-phosphate isomerase
MTHMITPIILSGGSGTRLWPLSTANHPKQFQPLVGPASLFVETAARTADPACFSAPVAVCGAAHVDHVARTDVDLGAIIVEPSARNTAPAIALAAHHCATVTDGDALMLVMPSDHHMTDPAAFVAAVRAATLPAQSGHIVTFGITPSGPATGYGYIAAGAPLGSCGACAVDRFVEKPPLADAKAMLAAGGYYWNAGIFLMTAATYLNALTQHAPEVASAAARAFANATRTGLAVYPDAAAFAAAPSISIDYAVMEKASNGAVQPVDPGWSDVGSWAALHAIGAHDASGNVVQGNAALVEAAGNLVHAAPGKRIAVLGVEGLIIVANGDDIMVAPLARAEDVKKLLPD